MKRLLLVFSLGVTFVILASVALTAQASGNPQGPQFATPTPGPDGRILYTVQEGDSCIRISLLTGVPLDQLRALNRLDTDCTLTVGQQLLIGVGGPSGGTATSGPAPTDTPAQPTPTPQPGKGNICVLLYDDTNGDGLRQDAENAINGGAVSVTGTSGQYSHALTTQGGTDPICFNDVPEGTYNISVAAPSGYNPTTQFNYTLELKPGDQSYVAFGAQTAAESSSTTTNPTNTPSGSLLGIVGGILLLSGIGLAFYAWRVYGQGSMYGSGKKPPLPPLKLKK